MILMMISNPEYKEGERKRKPTLVAGSLASLGSGKERKNENAHQKHGPERLAVPSQVPKEIVVKSVCDRYPA
jgi:hypothetical protein